MKIIKNGFYKIFDIKEEKIKIADNLNVIFFDDGKKSRKIEIGNNSRLEIYGYLNNIDLYNLEILVNGENSNLKLGYLLIAGNDEKLNVKISSKINASNSNAYIKIMSIVGTNGKINLDGILNINKGIKNIIGDLIEENLFIGDTGIINSIPSLFVLSNDVKANHSCKIEKISDEKLFYLRSRGITKEDSLNMMIESGVNSLFKCLTMLNNDYYISLMEEINKKIKNINLKKEKGI